MLGHYFHFPFLFSPIRSQKMNSCDEVTCLHATWQAAARLIRPRDSNCMCSISLVKYEPGLSITTMGWAICACALPLALSHEKRQLRQIFPSRWLFNWQHSIQIGCSSFQPYSYIIYLSNFSAILDFFWEFSKIKKVLL